MKAHNELRGTIVITGAAGFIGSNLCRQLLRRSRRTHIVAIDNMSPYYSRKIKQRRISEFSTHRRFTFYNTSVLDQKKIVSILRIHKADMVIHAAAAVGVRNGEQKPFSYFRTNIIGTTTLLEAIPASVRHILIMGSSSVYGSSPNTPYKEEELITLTTPFSVYGTSKAAMEMVSHIFFRRMKIPITIVRPFSVYGPDGRPDMLPMKLLISSRLKKQLEIYGPSINYRDWTYIDDVVDAIIAISKKPDGFQIVNIGRGIPLRLDKTIEIAQKVIEKYGYSISFMPLPAKRTELAISHASTRKLEKKYNVQLKTAFKDGFSKTAAFFFAHEMLYI